MKICMQTLSICEHYGEREGIKLLAEAGFDSIDFSMFWDIGSGILAESDEVVRAHFTELRTYIDSLGLPVYQSHAPIASAKEWTEQYEDVIEATRKAMLASGILGAKYVIVHPLDIARLADGSVVHRLYDRYAAENRTANLAFFSRLKPFIDEYGVKVAIENEFGYDPVRKIICPTTCSDPAEIADYVDTLNTDGERFVACLDTGHANIACRDRSQREIIRILGGRLKCLHIHDNDGLNDSHDAPGVGNIDWEDFCLGLRDIGYDGDYIFEADRFYNRFDASLIPDVNRLLYGIGRAMCEKYGL